MFYFEEFDITIVQLDCKTSNIEIFDIKSNFVICEIFRTRTTKTINIELIDNLNNKYFIIQILD